jgi:hypothetical protein
MFIQSFIVDAGLSIQKAVVVGVKYNVTFCKKKSITSMHVFEKHVMCVPWCFAIYITVLFPRVNSFFSDDYFVDLFLV